MPSHSVSGDLIQLPMRRAPDGHQVLRLDCEDHFIDMSLHWDDLIEYHARVEDNAPTVDEVKTKSGEKKNGEKGKGVEKRAHCTCDASEEGHKTTHQRLLPTIYGTAP